VLAALPHSEAVPALLRALVAHKAKLDLLDASQDTPLDIAGARLALRVLRQPRQALR